MIVHTSRFGTVEVDDDRVITFARGILGFPKHKGFVLIQPEADATFYWLQSVDAADGQTAPSNRPSASPTNTRFQSEIFVMSPPASRRPAT